MKHLDNEYYIALMINRVPHSVSRPDFFYEMCNRIRR